MINKLLDTNWRPCSHTAISTVGYGEITPRSFFGRLVTLPLLLFGLLLIALPSFVLGREFSIVWNEMMSGHTPRTPYTQPRHNFTHSEVVRFGPMMCLTTLAVCLIEPFRNLVFPESFPFRTAADPLR
jgi:hypothetical protein